jgi:hypothetical protein
MPITESAYPHDDFARLRAYPGVVSEYHRTAALEGFEALFAAVGAVARGSNDPDDIVDDAVREKYYENLCDLKRVHEVIKEPAMMSRKYDDDYQEAIGNLPSFKAFCDFPGLDFDQFKCGMCALRAYEMCDSDDDDN